MRPWHRSPPGRAMAGENAALYVILLVSLLHLAWACLLGWSSAAAGSTPVSAVITAFGSRIAAVALLAGTAVLALAATWYCQSPRYAPPGRRVLAATLLPQQVLLLISAFSGIAAAIAGHYADGVIRPWQFIIGDQLPVILVAFLYTTAALAVISRAEGRSKTRPRGERPSAQMPP